MLGDTTSAPNKIYWQLSEKTTPYTQNKHQWLKLSSKPTCNASAQHPSTRSTTGNKTTSHISACNQHRLLKLSSEPTCPAIPAMYLVNYWQQDRDLLLKWEQQLLTLPATSIGCLNYPASQLGNFSVQQSQSCNWSTTGNKTGGNSCLSEISNSSHFSLQPIQAAEILQPANWAIHLCSNPNIRVQLLATTCCLS